MDGSGFTTLKEVSLSAPVLIAAFRGWNDAGEAASFAGDHLRRVWNGEKVAKIDPEEFFDFQAVRPQVELTDGATRNIIWPANDLYAARLPGATHDALILVGTEPNLRWRTFANMIVEFARAHAVKLVLSFGSLLADVPHSRPVHVTGTAVDPELIQRLGLERSRYEGPTGIVGVLHDACAAAGLPSASLWTAVPHYLGVTPNPKAALALVDRAVKLIGAQADVGELHRAALVYDQKVEELVESDEDIQRYVEMLEERDDQSSEIAEEELPSGDALAAELERYLRQRDDER